MQNFKIRLEKNLSDNRIILIYLKTLKIKDIQKIFLLISFSELYLIAQYNLN